MRTWCRIIVGIMALIVGFSAPMSVYALSDSQMDFFAQNNILFYDPDNNCVSDADIKGDSDGSDVYMIGDFITANSEDIIKSLMPNITINAGDNASFSSGVSMVNNMGEQNILVFALGTNGGINGTESFLNAVSGKNIKVILMTIYNGTDENQMKGANNAVKNLAMQYDTITYIDWYSMASGDLVKYISADKIRPTSDGYSKFAKLVKESVDKVSTMNIPTNVGDGDYSRVLNAKNADKYVFNVANYSEWSARWGDGNVEQMTKVLNNYGDLAYHTLVK